MVFPESNKGGAEPPKQGKEEQGKEKHVGNGDGGQPHDMQAAHGHDGGLDIGQDTAYHKVLHHESMQSRVWSAFTGLAHSAVKLCFSAIDGADECLDAILRERLQGKDFPRGKIPAAERPKPAQFHIHGFYGELYRDVFCRTLAATDFGKHRKEIPWGVARCPQTTDLDSQARNIAALVKFARSRKMRIAVRGADIFDRYETAHSTGGQSMVLDGLVIDASPISSIHFFQRNNDWFVRVGAGCTWRDLIAECKERNMCVPVSTANLFLTVGGTLSVLAAEYTTTTRGPAVDRIEEMTCVTGVGDVVKCGRDSVGAEGDLFNAVRCGLGEYGVIVDVTFKLETELPRVRVYNLAYTNMDDAMTALLYLNHCEGVTGVIAEVLPPMEVVVATKDPLGGEHQIPVVISPWVQMKIRLPRYTSSVPAELKRKNLKYIYLIDIVCYDYPGKPQFNAEAVFKDTQNVPEPVGVWHKEYDMFTYKSSVDSTLVLDMKFGSWNSPHTQFSVFVPKSKYRELADEMLKIYEDPAVYTTTVIFDICPYRSGCIKAPGFMLPKLEVGPDGKEEDFVLLSTMGFVRTQVAAGGDLMEHRLGRQLARLQHMFDHIIKPRVPDAKVFPWAFIPYSFEEHYGPHWERQKRYKQMFDPDNVLGGCGVFTQTNPTEDAPSEPSTPVGPPTDPPAF